MKKIMSYILVSFLIIILCTLKMKAATYEIYTALYDCNLRQSASDKVSAVKSGNDDVKIYKNGVAEYISTETGPNNGLSNQTWYKVKIDYAAREYVGYIAKACMNDKVSYSYNDDASFEESIKNFPDSYKIYLRKLHSMYPNWKFKADYTNILWNDVSNAEGQKGTSAISYLYPSLIFKDSLNPNGIIVDGTNWYAPCLDAVKYYLDPRNFLNQKSIFMFRSLSFNELEVNSVKNVLNGSFMSSDMYVNLFIQAGRESGVSAIYLASLSLQEMGTTISSAASGTVSGYEGYYNFYNIGATSGADNYLKGLQRAKNEGWNSIEKSIIGGAKFIASNYINNGQDTIYYKKYNVSSYHKSNLYTNQYQTNIMAPKTEAESIFNSFKANNKLNDSYTFVIPVYNQMTQTAFKVSRTDTVAGSTEVEKEEQITNENSTISVEDAIKKSGYKITNGFLTGLTYKQDISILRENINKNISASTLNSSWSPKNIGNIATGDLVSINDKVFEVSLYGDVSGDGEITIKDLLLIKKHLLGDNRLQGSYLESAKIAKEQNVTIKDLLLLKKQLLGEYTINQ